MTILKKQQKLLYLERLLNLQTKFLRAYNSAKVTLVVKEEENYTVKVKENDGYGGIIEKSIMKTKKIPPTKFVRVSYYDTKINMYESYSIEFPLTHLSKRIAHYKRKFNTAYKNRHNINNK